MVIIMIIRVEKKTKYYAHRGATTKNTLALNVRGTLIVAGHGQRFSTD